MFKFKKLPWHLFVSALCVMLVATAALLYMPQIVKACDVAVVSAKASATGRPIIWKNFDCSSYWKQEIKRLPSINNKAGASYFIYHDDDVMAAINKGKPFMPQAGVNEKGFAMSLAAVYEDLNPAHETFNINTDLMQDAVQNCGTISDFEAYMQEWPKTHNGHAISGNYVAIDAQGGAVMYELSTGNTSAGYMPIKYTKYDANTGKIVDSYGTVLQVAQDNFVGFWNRTNVSKYVSYNSGSERYGRAYDLLESMAEHNQLTPENIMKKVAKDVNGVQYAMYGTTRSYSTTYAISRSATRSATVIEGVAPGNDPRLTTMWNALGEPSLSVFVPTIVGAEAVGDYVHMDTVAANGTLSDTSDTCLLNIAEDNMETKNEIYSSNRGNSITAMNDKTINKVKMEEVQKWSFEIESMLIAKTNELLDNCRTDSSLIKPAVLAPFTNYASKYAYENYAAQSSSAIAWNYDIPSTTSPDAPAASISYNSSDATNGSVVATLVPDQTVTIMNNGGKTTYTFTKNGSFPFYFKNAAGKTGTAVANVNWITEEVAADSAQVSLTAVGDINFGRNVAAKIKSQGTDYPFKKLGGRLAASDITIGNLECPLTNSGQAQTGKSATFRGDPAMADVMQQQGFDVLSIANNHATDYGVQGLTETITLLNNKGINPIGAGENLADARKATIITRDGLRIGFLAYTNVYKYNYFYMESMKSNAATDSTPGVAQINQDMIQQDIKALDPLTDVIVVSLHWGDEYYAVPNYDQKVMAHDLIDSGADLIIGHHPHRLQGVERYKDGLIAYSLGNFVFDQSWAKYVRQSAILDVELAPGKVVGASVTPVLITDSQPALLTGSEAQSLLSTMAGYSTKLNTTTTIQNDKLIIK